MSIVHLCDRCSAIAYTIDTASVTIPTESPYDPTGNAPKTDCAVALSGLTTNHDLCTTCLTSMLIEIVVSFKLPTPTIAAILEHIQTVVAAQSISSISLID